MNVMLLVLTLGSAFWFATASVSAQLEDLEEAKQLYKQVT